jgi:hypothetical protein
MNVSLTVFSESEKILGMVGDFARGLGCKVDAEAASGRSVRTELPDAGESLLELLDYVALSATKANVDTAEPLCRVTYWHPGAAAEVTLGLRLVEFSLDRTPSTGG